jgi:amino-acid N-acetyltransferase
LIAAIDPGSDTLVQITPSAPSAAARTAPRVAVSERMDRAVPDITVRAARIADMRQVEALVNGFARDNLMLPKTYDQLARLFREFVVAVDAEERVVGCGALRVYSDQLAEIASLAVDESVHGAGIGRRLVQRLVEEAGALGIRTVFALTLQEPFFHRLGFRTVPRENFPGKVWADCRSCPKLHACDEIAVALEVGAWSPQS